MEKFEQKLNEIETKVISLSNIAKVIGIVAIIFGIAGGWGYSILIEAKQQIYDLKKELEIADKRFSNLRKEEEKKLSKFAQEKKISLKKIAKTWPGGSYCVARRGSSCPVGFKQGKLHLDTEDDKSANSWGGTLPSFGYRKNNIDMYYCCKGK